MLIHGVIRSVRENLVHEHVLRHYFRKEHAFSEQRTGWLFLGDNAIFGVCLLLFFHLVKISLLNFESSLVINGPLFDHEPLNQSRDSLHRSWSLPLVVIFIIFLGFLLIEAILRPLEYVRLELSLRIDLLILISMNSFLRFSLKHTWVPLWVLLTLTCSGFV